MLKAPPLASSSSRTIYLLRHGETVLSGGARRYIGWRDIALSETGIRQAKEWAARLSSSGLQAIYSSDLSRCRDTADIIGRACGREACVTPEFREIHLGEWEGVSFEEMKSGYPERYAERGRRIADHRPPGGESFRDLQNRVWPKFLELAAVDKNRILIVTHAGVIRVLLCRILGMPLSNLFRIGIDPGSLTVVTSHPDKTEVDASNKKFESVNQVLTMSLLVSGVTIREKLNRH